MLDLHAHAPTFHAPLPPSLLQLLSDAGASDLAWYPPLRNTLLVLSKLYRAVDARIFSGLAQEAVAAATGSVQAAGRAVGRNAALAGAAANNAAAAADGGAGAAGAGSVLALSGQLDALLFVVKHLLFLREQVRAHNAWAQEFVGT